VKEVEVFKNLLIERIESELKQHGYISSQRIENIISEVIYECFDIDAENVKKLKIAKPVYWSFITPFYNAYLSYNGMPDSSGIYSFKRDVAEKRWKTYKADFEKRLKATRVRG
jgi:hypothetical protein